ncbi:MAG: hypothetical protein COA57_16555, partial [Flavobacteriales bacterium]
SVLAGNTPTTGTGAWSTIAGTGSADVIADPTSVVSGLTIGGSSTLRWTISNGVCPSSTDDVTINVDASPTVAAAGPDQNLCNVITTTLAANIPTTGTGAWSTISGTGSADVVGDPTSTVSGLTIGGSSTLRWTISNGVCPASTDDVIINVDALPTTADAGPDQGLCGVTTSTLAGNTPTSGTGAWTTIFGTGSADVPASPTSTVSGLTIGASSTLRWTISNGVCPASTDDVVITADDVPTVAAAGPDQVLCNITTTTLAGNTPTVGTGAWSTIAGTGSADVPADPTSTVSGLTIGASTTFRWTISSGSCGSTSDDVVVTVDAAPTVADAGPDQSLCNVTSTILAGNTPTTGTGTWSIVSGSCTITTPASPTSTVTGLSAGSSVTLRWTISNASCPASTDDVNITVASTPSSAAAGPDQILCNVITSTLAGNTPTSGTGTWTVVAGAATVTTPADPTSGVTGLVIGATVSLEWAVSNGTCITNRDTMTIQVDASPTVSAAGPDQNLCNVITAILAGNAPAVGTGVWSTVLGTGNADVVADPTSTVSGLTIGGSSTLRWTISNGVCPSSTDDVVINVDANPTVAAAGADQNLCNVITTILAANTPTTGIGSWSTVLGSGVADVVADPTSTASGLTIGGSTTLRWTISNGVCPSSTDDVVINVDASPTTSAAGPDQNLCNVTIATLAGNAPATGSGTWTVISGTATVTTPSSATSGVTGLVIGASAQLEWAISNGVCTTSRDTMTIQVDAPPTASDAGPNQSICASTATLAGNTPTTGTGTWTVVSGAGIVTTPSGPTSTITGLTAGTTRVEWAISNGACGISRDTVQIDIGAIPIIDAGPDQNLCNVTTTTLAGNIPGSGSGAWTVLAGGATVTTPTSPTSGVTGLTTGLNQFEWTITDAGCVSSDIVDVNVFDIPTVSDAGPDQTICATTTTLAGNTPVTGTGAWAVIFGSSTVTTPSSSTSTVTGLTPGSSDTLTWTISNGACSSDIDTVVINVDQNSTTAAAGPDQNLCNVTTSTLAGNTPTIGSGLWAVIGGLSIVTAPASPISGITGLTIGSSDTLTWTISNGVCPNSVDTVIINVADLPTVAAAGPDQNLCGVTTATLAGNAPTFGTGNWSVFSGTATITDPTNPTSGVTGLVLDASATLRWTISSGACVASTDDVVISTDATPTTAAAGIDQNLCNVTTATLAGNTPSSGTGAWAVIFGLSSVTVAADPTSAVTGLTIGSTDTLTWTISNGVCPNSVDTMVISVDANPTVAAAGPDQNLCNVTTATLAGNVPTTGTGTWTLILGTATITTPSLATSGVTGLAVGGSATLRWTIANGVCASSTDDVIINVDQEPTISTAGPDQLLCAASTTILAGNTPTIGTGSWSVVFGTATVDVPASPTSAVSGLVAATTDTLRWTISNGVCPASTDDMVIDNGDAVTIAAAGPDQNLCNVTTATLAGNTPAVGTGAWSVVSGIVTVTTPSSPTSGVTGLVIGTSATLRWTITSGSCVPSTDDVIISVDDPPTTAAAGADQTLCNVTTSTLAGNTPVIGIGTWAVIFGSSTVTTPSSPTSGVTGLTSGSTDTLTWTISNGVCPNSVDTMWLQIDQSPTTAAAGSDQNLCNITTSALAGNTPTVGTGAWSTIAGSGTADVPALATSTVSGLTIGASTTLRWTISNGVCPSSTDDITINVADPPTTAAAGPDQNLCNVITTTLAGNTPAIGTGSWSVVLGIATVDVPADPTSTVSGLVIGASATLRWTTTNGACTSTDDVIISVDDLPTTAAAGADQNLCNVTTATLAGNTPTVGTGAWSTIAGSGTADTPGSPTSGVSGLTIGGSTTLRWMISNGACPSSTDDVIINVAATPTTAAAGSDQGLCNVITTTLAGNTPSDGTGSWSVVSGTATVDVPADPTSTVSAMVVGDTATLRWTISNGGCTPSTDDVTIIVYDLPTTAAAGLDQNLCATTTTTLAGNIPTVGIGNWTVIAGAATITTPSSPTSTVTGLVLDASATLRWTISNGTCPSSFDDVTVSVDASPTVAAAGPDHNLCNVITTTLAANTPTTGTGAWSTVSGTGSADVVADPTSTASGLTISGSSTLRWTISNGVCPASTDDIVINVAGIPTTAAAGPDQNLCNVTTATLAGNAPAVGTGAWSTISGTGTADTPSSETSTVSGLTIGGSSTLRWTISSGACPSSTDEVTINVDIQPISSAGPDQDLCNVTSTILAGNTPTAGTGIWVVIAGTSVVSAPVDPTSTLTGLGPGASDTLTWTLTNGVCPASVDTVVISVSTPVTAAAAGPDQTLCNVTTTTLAGNIPTTGTGSWSTILGTGTADTPSSETSTVSGLTVGASTTLRWTILNLGCSSTDDVVITVNNPPVIAAAGPDQNLCTTTTTTLAGNDPAPGTGSWSVISGPAIIADPTNFASSVSNVNLGTSSTLVWTVSSGICAPSTDTVIISAYDLPTTANAGPDGTLCNSATTILAGNTPTIGTGIWSVISGTATVDTPSDPTSTVSGMIPGTTVTFRWTISSGSCAPSSDDVTLQIDELPTTADAGLGQALCGLTSTTMTANTPTVGTGNWTLIAGTGTIADASDPVTGITGLLTSTSSTYKWTISNGFCPNSTDDIIISVDLPLTVPNAGPDQTVCNDDSTMLAANTSIVGTGTWSVFSGTGIVTDPLNESSSITGMTIGASTTLVWTISSATCGSASDTMTITVDELPTTSAAGSDQNICDITTATLAANTPTIGTGNWALMSGTGTFADSLNPVTTVSSLIIGASSIFRWTIINGSCAPSVDDITINVATSPTASAGPDQNLCDTTATTLAGNVPTEGTGTWSVVSGTATITATSDPTTTITGLVIGDSVVLRWTIVNGSCPVSTDDVTIIVYDQPTVAAAGPDQNLCSSTTTTMTGNVPTVGTGVWSVTSGTATFTDSTNATTAVSGLTIGSTAILKWTISNGICVSSSDEMIVNVATQPTANAGLDQQLCDTTQTTLAGNTATEGTGTWTLVSGTAVIADVNDPFSNVTGLTIGGTDTLVWSITNSTCVLSEDTVVINIYDVPTTANAGIDQTLCNVTSTTLSGNTPAIGTGSWSVISGTGTVTDTLNPSSTITGLTVGTLTTLRWTISNGACLNSTDDVIIQIDDLPTTANAGINQVLCGVSSATLAANVATIGTGTWSVISGTASVSSVNDPTSAVTGLVAGTSDTLRWTISNGVCPPSSDDMAIQIDETPTAANAGPDQNLCNVITTTLAGNTPTIGTGSWSTVSGTATAGVPTDPTSTVSGLTIGGTSVLRWTTTNGSCAPSTDDVIITSYELATTANAGVDQIICSDTSTTMAANVAVIGTGTWSVITGTATIALPNDPTSQMNGLVAGTDDTLLWTIANGACPATSDTVALNVIFSPTADAGTNQTVCANNPAATLSGIITEAAGGVWSTSGSGIFDDTVSMTATYMPSDIDTATGTIFLILTSTGNGNCTAAVDSMTLTILPAPVVNAGLDEVVCSDTAGVALNGLISNAPGGIWTTSGTGTFSDSSNLNATYVPSIVDTIGYTDILVLSSVIANGCLLVTDTMLANFTPEPYLDAGADITVCVHGPAIALSGYVTGGASTAK